MPKLRWMGMVCVGVMWMVGTMWVLMWVCHAWLTHNNTLQTFRVFILTRAATFPTSSQTRTPFIAVRVTTSTSTPR